MEFKTDLNDRERTRFIEQLKNLEKLAGDVGRALESRDDKELFASFLVFSMSLTSLHEMREILMSSLLAMKDKKDADDFPEIIHP